MTFPEVIRFASQTGEIGPATGGYAIRLSQIAGYFQDSMAEAAAIAADDPVIYTVREYRQPGADLYCGTTTMEAGRVGREYYMTRGHYHARPDIGEIYLTLSGRGLLLLENRAGETRELEMAPKSLTFIPPGWAHRSVNTGDAPLVFFWALDVEAGADHAGIGAAGMLKIVVDDGQQTVLRDNPRRSGRA